MFVDRMSTYRDRPSDGACAEKKERGECGKPCEWAFDDQTGRFACRDSWWNLCGNESGKWFYDENAMGGAHCCK